MHYRIEVRAGRWSFFHPITYPVFAEAFKAWRRFRDECPQLANKSHIILIDID